MIKCPSCHSKNLRKKGFSDCRKQRYACKDCGRIFTGNLQGRPATPGRDLQILIELPEALGMELKQVAYAKKLKISEFAELIFNKILKVKIKDQTYEKVLSIWEIQIIKELIDNGWFETLKSQVDTKMMYREIFNWKFYLEPGYIIVIYKDYAFAIPHSGNIIENNYCHFDTVMSQAETLISKLSNKEKEISAVNY